MKTTNSTLKFAKNSPLTNALIGLGLTAGLMGCGSEENRTTLNSPVQAVTTLFEKADGTVEAELVLISTKANPDAFIDTATSARVRVPGGASVPLTLTSAGHYSSDSEEDADLTYQAGETYQFSFSLTDEELAGSVSGGNFVAVMTAPGDEPAFEFSKYPEFAGFPSTISWSPSTLYGVIQITNEDGETVYSNFDFSEPAFNGSKWARLTKGGSKDLSVDVFQTAGTYTINFCAVDKVSDFNSDLSAELGAFSGFLIGRCAAPMELAVAE